MDTGWRRKVTNPKSPFHPWGRVEKRRTSATFFFAWAGAAAASLARLLESGSARPVAIDQRRRSRRERRSARSIDASLRVIKPRVAETLRRRCKPDYSKLTANPPAEPLPAECLHGRRDLHRADRRRLPCSWHSRFRMRMLRPGSAGREQGGRGRETVLRLRPSIHGDDPLCNLG